MPAVRLNEIIRLENEIRSVISHSKIKEDPIHSQNTLEWLLKLKPDADETLKIAALGHDIERAIEKSKIKRENFPHYDAFKEAHAKNSARIFGNIIKNYTLEQQVKEEICRLVRYHETGGDPRSDLIRDADSLSFFDVNLPLFFEREGWDKAAERCRWGYNRLSLDLKLIIQGFKYDNSEVNALLRTFTSR